MAVKIQSDNSADQARVDTGKAIYERPRGANQTDLSGKAGAQAATNQDALQIGGLNDSQMYPLRVDRLGNLIIGKATTLLYEWFEGTTINTQKFSGTNTTFAPTQSASGLSLNPGEFDGWVSGECAAVQETICKGPASSTPG
jgi:hypothetical protein